MIMIAIIISGKNIWISKCKLLINLIVILEHMCLTRAKTRILIYVIYICSDSYESCNLD